MNSIIQTEGVRPAPGSSLGPASLLEAMPFDRLPTSFGVFKPVGCVMVALPTRADADKATAAWIRSGRAAADVHAYASEQILPDLESMAAHEGILANIGFEIVLVRRFIELARQHHHWLLIDVEGAIDAAAVADIARSCSATVAIHYRRLTVEELI